MALADDIGRDIRPKTSVHAEPDADEEGGPPDDDADDDKPGKYGRMVRIAIRDNDDAALEEAIRACVESGNY